MRSPSVTLARPTRVMPTSASTKSSAIVIWLR
jgi:hypothetical protein